MWFSKKKRVISIQPTTNSSPAQNMLEETCLSVEGGFCLWKYLYLVFQFDSGGHPYVLMKEGLAEETFRNALESPGICVQGAKGEVAKHPDAVTDC